MDKDNTGYVTKAEYDSYAAKYPTTLRVLANKMTPDEFFNYLAGQKNYFTIDKIRAYTLKQFPGPITE